MIIAVLSILVIAYGVIAVASGSSANNTYYFIFGLLTLVSCLIWLRVRNVGVLRNLDTPPSYELFLLGNVLFFLFLGCAVLSFQLRADVYVRPLTYFIFAALMASALPWILTSDTKGKSAWLILTQIIILGCTLQFSELLLFPSVVGADPWADQQFTLQLISSGHSAAGGLPIHHPTVVFSHCRVDFSAVRPRLQVVGDALGRAIAHHHVHLVHVSSWQIVD